MERAFERYREFIPFFDDFQDRLRTPLPQCLRVNTLKIRTETLLQALKRKGIFLKAALSPEEPVFLAPENASPGKWLEYALGYIHPQALTSCVASLFLGPEKGSCVLDLCAAPGGKTSHLSQLMMGEGLIVANELQRRRHLPLLNTLSRLGVLNTVLTGYPAQEFPFRGKFDYVLADVPCSGEGTFRYSLKHSPGAGKGEGPDFCRTQERIILRGFDLLKETGKMLYATCTYNPRENEAIVAHLLKHRDAEILEIDSPLSFRPGLSGWERETYSGDMKNAARFYPHYVDSVGFFMAKIGRRK
jgi:tRNA (cytosine49-C5)-methyltransferase